MMKITTFCLPDSDNLGFVDLFRAAYAAEEDKSDFRRVQPPAAYFFTKKSRQKSLRGNPLKPRYYGGDK